MSALWQCSQERSGGVSQRCDAFWAESGRYKRLLDARTAEGNVLDEQEVFKYFALARSEVLGHELSNVTKSESPDFLADDTSWGAAGIELTDARPGMSEDDMDFLEVFMNEEVEFDYLDAAAHIYSAVERKEAKRTRPHWQRPDETILVVRAFTDIRPLIRHLRTLTPQDVMPPHGFKEVWVQDYELSFEKDGNLLSAAVVCLHPKWLANLVYRIHRRSGFTTRHR